MNMPKNTIRESEKVARRQRVVKFLTHLICISILFILPEFVTTTGRPFQSVPALKWGVYAKALVFIVVFYVDYYFVIGRWPENGRSVWRMIGWNVLIVIGALGLFSLINSWMRPLWDEAWRLKQQARGLSPDRVHHHHFQQTHWAIEWLKVYSRDFVMTVLTIALSVAVKLSDSWMRHSRRSAQLLASHRQEELSNLKQQLNPHFLFNTLNSIYALIAISPDSAREAVHELSSMLRYVLYDNSAEVELDRELNFIRNYVKLMTLRLPSATKVECSLSAGNEASRPIPPMLFITLIENTFKHCDTGEPESFINIAISASGEGVECLTENSVGIGRHSRHEGGIGLRNLQRRLQLIYGNKASLEIAEEEGRFRARMWLPF